MSQEIEIEFKNMLTKEQYESLLQHFHVQPEQIKYQVNHYFDTESWQLKQLMSGLRIRQIDNYFECTLKEKTSEKPLRREKRHGKTGPEGCARRNT